MQVDLSSLNTHFHISLLVSILFCNVYMIFVLSRNEKVTSKTIQKPSKKIKVSNTSFPNSRGKAKIKPKVNDDREYMRKQLKEENEN